MTAQVSWLDFSIMREDLRGLRQAVEEQAADEGLWNAPPSPSAMGYLRHELRTLHEQIERATRWLAE